MSERRKEGGPVLGAVSWSPDYGKGGFLPGGIYIENITRPLKDFISKPKLKVYKIADNAPDLTRATKMSACFDMRAYIQPSVEITGYTKKNMKFLYHPEFKNQNHYIVLGGGERALIPTGLIFDIPEGYSVRVHPRSGLSLKLGLSLANAEGIVDADFVEQVHVILHNTSDEPFTVINGERLCQIELVKDLDYDIEYTTEKPEKKSSRDGGFGHSGVK